MVDIYLAIAIVIVLASVLVFYISFRFIKQRLTEKFKNEWSYIETEIYQNIVTEDVVVVSPGEMELVTEGQYKGYYKRKPPQKLINYYDKIEEDLFV